MPSCGVWRYYTNNWSSGRTVSTVSDYRLDDRASIPVRSKGISSSLGVQISSQAYPASNPMGIGVLSPGVNRGRVVTLIIYPHLVPKWRIEARFPHPVAPTWRSRTASLTLLYKTNYSYSLFVWLHLHHQTCFVSCRFIVRGSVIYILGSKMYNKIH
jgi:hypothetical protein